MKRQFTIIFLFVFARLFSQVTLSEISTKTNIKYGSDDILINGGNYVPLHPAAHGDAFFMENAFYNGKLLLKGRQFEDIAIKFDIEQQKLLLRLDSVSAEYSIIQLNDNYIKEFYIHGQHFINLNNRGIHNSGMTFVELVYDGGFLFVKYYKKEFLTVFSNKHPYGRYSETKTEKYIFRNGEKIRLKSKRDLYDAFPGNNAMIKLFIKQNRIRFRKASNKKLLILMKYCDGFD
ncbi:MAG: hypothetical protein GXO88_08425 [Chlorobi bacterium]|nr:hypothetical protein [Chlorobiota bacterium]